MLKGKKILFFSINFFGYHKSIKRKLEELGAEVDFYDERPKNTFQYKLIIRLNKKLANRKIKAYYDNIIKTTKDKNYDYIFLIKGEVITSKTIDKLKQHHKKAKCILYLWDAIKHRKSVKKLFPKFDKILSFDLNDTKKNPHLIFRPLFFLDTFSQISSSKNATNYDIAFIGTAHYDRYPVLMRIKNLCKKNSFKTFFYIYLQDQNLFYYRKLFYPAFKNAKKKDFKYSPISKDDIKHIYKNTKCILDIEQVIQSGLTMRTLEVLGAKRKLITTNETIKSYDFYNENNILVINRDNPIIPIEFVHSNYQDIDENIYKKYSLKNWINDVFS